MLFLQHPSDPIVWRKDLSDADKTKIKEFFLTYGTDKSTGDVAAEKEVLKGLKWAPFRQSSDKQLLPIRVMELTKSISQIEADTAMAADERTKKLEELKAQKAKYEAELAVAG